MEFEKEYSPFPTVPSAPPFPPPLPSDHEEEHSTVTEATAAGALTNKPKSSNPPTANSLKPVPWSTGLCDCCDDCHSCKLQRILIL